MTGARVRVLIVDDSALVRRMLTEMLSADPALEVVGTAPDPYVARDKIKLLDPDVITLDVEMPRMDGVTFLGNLMRLRPTPVVMISSLTEAGADITLDALACGAVDFVTKPKIDMARGLADYAEEIVRKVKAAASANLSNCGRLPVAGEPRTAAAPASPASRRPFRTTEQIVAIGASTGGVEALRVVLERLPPDVPGIVITQHIPEKFSATFAERMDRLCEVRVSEARHGEQIRPGHVYVAPGNRHLAVGRDGARYICRVTDDPPMNRHRPSVDVLFKSVADNAGQNALGIILTGMGNDGAQGLLQMRQAGAHTIAQDERTSVVWGMPGEAVKAGAAAEVLPLQAVARAIVAQGSVPE